MLAVVLYVLAVCLAALVIVARMIVHAVQYRRDRHLDELQAKYRRKQAILRAQGRSRG